MRRWVRLGLLGLASWPSLAWAAAPVRMTLPADLAPTPFASTEAQLFFRGERPGEGVHLWQTDGTATHPVWTDEGDELEGPAFLTTSNGWLYFTATPADADATSTAFFRTDGASVQRLAAVPARRAFAATGRIYFTVPAGDHDTLWLASAAGIGPLPLAVAPDAPAVGVGSQLLFAGHDSRPWLTEDGAAAAAPLAGPDAAAGTFAAVGTWGTFFSTRDGTTTLWRTDGAAASVITTWATDTDGFAHDAVGFARLLYFRARVSAAQPWALFRSDGTAAGTSPLASLDDDALDAPMLGAGSRFYFVARHGSETALFATDGGAPVPVVPHGVAALTALGERVYFPIDDTHLGGTDGTIAGTGTLELGADVGHVEGADGIFAVSGTNLYFTTITASDQNAQLWSLALPSPGSVAPAPAPSIEDAGADAAAPAALARAATDAVFEPKDEGCGCNAKDFFSPFLGLFGFAFLKRGPRRRP